MRVVHELQKQALESGDMHVHRIDVDMGRYLRMFGVGVAHATCGHLQRIERYCIYAQNTQ